jgi:glycosyltransferase involved in cell wall biosynthesis
MRFKKSLLTKTLHMIQNIEKEFPDNTVLIFQHQFFDFMGTQCYNGGAERYVQDLSDVLFTNKYNPVLVQMSTNGLWYKKVKKMTVIGIPADNIIQYQQMLPLFSKYKFVIYSGAVNWGEKLHPNILISHGITWDVHSKNCNPQEIFNIFKDVDKFVSVDTNTISWLRTTFSETLKDFDAHYIPNYVDTKKYFPIKRKNDKKIHITFPRRASPERGYWLMSAALSPILDKYPDVVFQFVGFAHGKEIQNDILLLEEKYSGRVSHCMVNPDEMPSIYQNTDISLVPTIYAEGTSLSCLEAQACGNVVITTNIGGLPNLVIDGFNGLLINPNKQELLNALDKVLSDKKLRLELSKNAVSVAHAFDIKIWKDRWSNIIKNTNKDI